MTSDQLQACALFELAEPVGELHLTVLLLDAPVVWLQSKLSYDRSKPNWPNGRDPSCHPSYQQYTSPTYTRQPLPDITTHLVGTRWDFYFYWWQVAQHRSKCPAMFCFTQTLSWHLYACWCDVIGMPHYNSRLACTGPYCTTAALNLAWVTWGSKRNLSVLEWLNSNADTNPLRLLKKRRLTERRKWKAYAQLFDSRCQMKHVEKEWWYKIHHTTQDFLSRLDSDVNKFFHHQMQAQDKYKHWLITNRFQIGWWNQHTALTSFLTSGLMCFCFCWVVPTRYKAAHVF